MPPPHRVPQCCICCTPSSAPHHSPRGWADHPSHQPNRTRRPRAASSTWPRTTPNPSTPGSATAAAGPGPRPGRTTASQGRGGSSSSRQVVAAPAATCRTALSPADASKDADTSCGVLHTGSSQGPKMKDSWAGPTWLTRCSHSRRRAGAHSPRVDFSIQGKPRDLKMKDSRAGSHPADEVPCAGTQPPAAQCLQARTALGHLRQSWADWSTSSIRPGSQSAPGACPCNSATKTTAEATPKSS